MLCVYFSNFLLYPLSLSIYFLHSFFCCLSLWSRHSCSDSLCFNHVQRFFFLPQNFSWVVWSQLLYSGREVLAERKDGSLFPAFVSVMDGNDGQQHFFAAHVRDLTSDKEEIRRMNMDCLRQHSILTYLDEPTLITDDKGGYWLYNFQLFIFFYSYVHESSRSLKLSVRVSLEYECSHLGYENKRNELNFI